MAFALCEYSFSKYCIWTFLSFLCTYFYDDVPRAGDAFPQTSAKLFELQVSLEKIILEIWGLNFVYGFNLLN